MTEPTFAEYQERITRNLSRLRRAQSVQVISALVAITAASFVLGVIVDRTSYRADSIAVAIVFAVGAVVADVAATVVVRRRRNFLRKSYRETIADNEGSATHD